MTIANRAPLAIGFACTALLIGQKGSSLPDVGPHPNLPPPQPSETARFCSVSPWPAGAHPTAPPGFHVQRFGGNLANPRWIYVLPNGDVLVAESGYARGKNRITLFRDADSDGMVESRHVFCDGLNQPFGMLLLHGRLYIANTDAILQFDYQPGQTRLSGPGRKIASLPAGGYNNHWTRNLAANPDGTKIYVTVGSASNVGEFGIREEQRRADILEMNPDGTGERVYASGLRNPNGLDWNPVTGELWTAVNERDLLGDYLVPDYITSVQAGAFYGWPYSYWGQHVDTRVTPQRPDLVRQAIAPDFAVGAHTASIGLVFYRGNAFPEHYRGGAFIGQHGSWNRSQFSGYKVVFVPFRNGRPQMPVEDFLSGFMPDPRTGRTHGRPVGVAVDRSGALLVADDAGNTVWRVTYSK